MRKIWQTIYQVIGLYPRVLKLVWKAAPLYTLFTVLLTIISSVVPPVQVWLSKVIIDRITEALQASAQGVPLNWYTILMPVGAIFLVWILGGACQSFSGGMKQLLGQKVQICGEYMVLRKAAQLDIAFYETPAFYDQMENARRDGYRIHNLAVLWLDAFGGFLSLGMMLWLLFRIHPVTVVVLLLTTVPQVLAGGYYAGRRFKLMGAHTPARRMAMYLSDLLGSRNAVKEIRLFGLHEPLLERFHTFWLKYFSEIKGLRFSQERSGLLLGFISMSGTAAIWGYAVIQAVISQITIGDVALTFQAAEQSRNRLSQLFGTIGLFYEHSLFAGNFFGFLDLVPDSVEGALSRKKQMGDQPLIVPRPTEEGIEFRNVSFRYPGSERLVLKNLSFIIRPGERVAIVGENGAGKTTLVKLLVRFYDPTEGTILLDDKDLKEYEVDDLRSQMGVIFQDFVRYDLSLRGKYRLWAG